MALETHRLWEQIPGTEIEIEIGVGDWGRLPMGNSLIALMILSTMVEERIQCATCMLEIYLCAESVYSFMLLYRL